MTPLLVALLALTQAPPTPAAYARKACESVVEVLPADTDERVAGAAFAVSAKWLVTSNHVVDGRKAVRIRTQGGRELVARVLARDLSTDLALLRVPNGHNLPPLQVGPVPGCGDDLFAVGHPLGRYSWSLMKGILSGTGRSVSTPVGFDVGTYQFSGGINPGNSGGPLLDDKGRVVGVVMAVRKKAQGIAFAVPATHFVSLYKLVEQPSPKKGKQ